MKQSVLIWVIVAMLVSCGRPSVETGLEPSPLHQDLSAIDSLMWNQPDSAFAMLLDFVESSEVDSLDEFNDHYWQLLISELLYKNDYGQSNREDLLRAMEYFDTLADAKGASLQRDVFLSARAHYMNGVGYFEMDSVVPACAEYLKALEIMEDYYEDEDFIGFKAKFMALVYTHLCGLFSEQYLHEQAIELGKSSIPYYEKHDASPWHLPWVLNRIGMHYDISGNLDSAWYYYDMASTLLPDTSCLMYRDIKALKIFLSYQKGTAPQTALEQLKDLLTQTESDKEYLSRCTAIGDICFREHCYDSAWKYLYPVFEESERIGSKKQAAEWLIEICKSEGKSYDVYADFLVPFAIQEENVGSGLKSRLAELYYVFIQNRQNRLHLKETRFYMKRIAVFVGALIVVTVVITVLYRGNKKRNKQLEKQITNERHAFKIQQKALGGRLKKSNEELRVKRKENEELLQKLKAFQRQNNWDGLNDFLSENICQVILSSLESIIFKRSINIDNYIDLRLGSEQLSQLGVAVGVHFPGLTQMLSELYPRISNDEMNQCLLCLLNLKDVQIAALLHYDYSTIKRRAVKMKNAFGTEKTLQLFIRELVL